MTKLNFKVPVVLVMLVFSVSCSLPVVISSEAKAYHQDQRLLYEIVEALQHDSVRPEDVIRRVSEKPTDSSLTNPRVKKLLKWPYYRPDKDLNEFVPNFEECEHVICWARPVLVKNVTNEVIDDDKIVGIAWLHNSDYPEIFYLRRSDR